MATTKYIITGEVKWAKIIKAGDNYQKDGKEYTVEVSVTDQVIADLTKLGIAEQVVNPSKGCMQSRYKEDAANGLRYLKVKQRAFLGADGEPTNPITVVGPDARSLVTTAVGNGSKARVQLLIKDLDSGKKAINLGAVQILEQVAFNNLPSEFTAVPGSETVAVVEDTGSTGVDANDFI